MLRAAKGSELLPRMNAASEAAAFRSRLRRYVASRVAPGDVDDVLQDAFVRLAAYEGEVRHPSGLAYRATQSAIVDHHRRNRPAPEVEAPFEPESKEARELVASWMKPLAHSLPEEEREAVMRVDFDGLTHAVAAAQLGIARSTLTSRVARGRARIKERLLRCCNVELDARGGVMDVHARGCTKC